MGEYSSTGAIADVDNPIENRFGWAWQELVDNNGTVVAWQDFTFDLDQDQRTFGTFWGDPSCYSGIETAWDGHVPTFLADFTSGIIPGSYRVKTWVFGYVQTREYTIDFPAVEFPGMSYMEMDIFKGGVINATVHFHMQELPSAEVDGSSIGGQLILEAYDGNGVLQAWNSTKDFVGPGWDGVAYPDGMSLMLIGQSNAWCEEGRVHGMPEGTYTIKAHKGNWVQQEFPQHTVQYCTNGSLSFHMVWGAHISLSVYSRDCQDPSQPIEWKHPGEVVELEAWTAAGSFFNPQYHLQGWWTQQAGTDLLPSTANGGGWWFADGPFGGGGLISDYFRTCGAIVGYGLPTDTYTVGAKTPGYVQLSDTDYQQTHTQ